MSTNDPYDQSQPVSPTPEPQAPSYGEQAAQQAQPYGAAQPPQPYGAAPQPGYAYPAAYPAQQPTNTLAIVALVGSFFIPIVGIICGHIAMSQIKKTGEQGRGLALAGLIIGYVLTAFLVIFIIIYVIFIAALIGSAGVYSS